MSRETIDKAHALWKHRYPRNKKTNPKDVFKDAADAHPTENYSYDQSTFCSELGSKKKTKQEPKEVKPLKTDKRKVIAVSFYQKKKNGGFRVKVLHLSGRIEDKIFKSSRRDAVLAMRDFIESPEMAKMRKKADIRVKIGFSQK